jgi:hypothetical protein
MTLKDMQTHTYLASSLIEAELSVKITSTFSFLIFLSSSTVIESRKAESRKQLRKVYT